CQQENNWPLTF
nr:immunoglobulin light chain junction region [Macaca mulatta]MOY00364.1 immunoglobulin light chain junction region [Macaca mulatta]